MKKLLWSVLIIGLGVGTYYSLSSNPVAINIISELAFTPQGWIIEININWEPYYSNTRDWYIVSKKDTAHLKEIQIEYDSYFLITKDSLLNAFDIDPEGDSLFLYTPTESWPLGFVIFGNDERAYVNPPAIGQSICKWKSYEFYLDNTPTLGFANDTLNAKGNIQGWVKNSANSPLQDVEIVWGDIGAPPLAVTDGSGYFSFRTIAEKMRPVFIKPGYDYAYPTIQVWPESTVTVNVVLSQIESVEKVKTEVIPSEFAISDPFPNPFNPETQIRYSLAQNCNVHIDIFNVSGKLVDKIFFGYQSKGVYIAHWNAIHLPSGVYIIRVRAGEQVLSKKCTLIK